MTAGFIEETILAVIEGAVAFSLGIRIILNRIAIIQTVAILRIRVLRVSVIATLSLRISEAAARISWLYH